jgi:heat shock protein HslJ
MKYRAVLCSLLLMLASGFCSAKGTKTLIVADRKVACAGTFECLQVKDKASAAWRNYSDTIAGFVYEEGYEYKISVLPLQTSNTLSGVYEEKYKLLKVISKRKTSYNPSAKLAGTKWILRSMNDTQKTLGIPDTAIFILFDLKAGVARGHAPCNAYTISFVTRGSKISLTNLSATKMLCKAEAVEKVIFNFFKSITTYKIEGRILTLSEPDGSYLQFEGR